PPGRRTLPTPRASDPSRHPRPRANAQSSPVPRPAVLRNLTGPCRVTSLGPVCRHHHRKPAPHKPPGPTRGSFTATGKATGTQNETEHSHWVPLAAATTGLGGPDLPDPQLAPPAQPHWVPFAATITANQPRTSHPGPRGARLPQQVRQPAPRTKPNTATGCP